jgi:hypothetical protein
MRLRRAVLQIPSKSSVPSRLPFYKDCPPPTHSKSTLPQLLIPLHFNSPRINTYKKPGGGPSFPLQSFTTRHYPHRAVAPGAARNLSVCSACPVLRRSAHQYHSMGLTRPLFSYSYALFCTLQSVNSFPLNHFRTLSTKHPGWGYFTLSSRAVSR